MLFSCPVFGRMAAVFVVVLLPPPPKKKKKPKKKPTYIHKHQTQIFEVLVPSIQPLFKNTHINTARIKAKSTGLCLPR